MTVPIGRPIANTDVFILDAAGEPLPVGVPGELYIGGVGLAEGYCSQPAETAERFVSHPFSDSRDARLYRTGDRVRYLPDGNVEFLGRVDDQAKIRGFRIEPREVQAILAAHPSVREGVVVTREDIPGEQRLVAYVIPAPGAVASSGELRSWVKTRLPDYMVPSAFVTMKAFPLTPNGKLDRRALPAPEREPSERPDVALRTPAERTVAGIWQEVLRVESVGAEDNFFDLGGHSLLATQVVSRMRTAFQRDLPIRWLFESPTVEQLAARVETAEREEIVRILDELESLPENGADRREISPRRSREVAAPASRRDAMSRPLAPDLAARIAGLSPAKRELLERKLRERPTEALPAGSIPRRAERGTAPLSFAQQALYFLDRLEPGSATYNVVRAIRIRGRAGRRGAREGPRGGAASARIAAHPLP